MISYDYIIQDPSGIHARPATQIAFFGMNQQDKITIIHDGQMIDGSNVIEVMNLHAQCGDTLTFQIEGEQEEKTLEALREVLDSLE
ncbi:MAG: HPr family phosphocarrier protein [Lachnospiraceae bacterium]|nr:HPr family phosphocarrier protein [Lachnospiraceae bacterium]